MFKLFSWCIQLQIAFHDGEPLRRDYLNVGTDLCHFVRTILVTTPVIILFHVLALMMPVLALFVMPYFWFEAKGVIISTSIIVGVSVIIFGYMLVKDIYDKLSKTKTSSATELTFGHLMATYLMAKKSKICPLIHWKETK